MVGFTLTFSPRILHVFLSRPSAWADQLERAFQDPLQGSMTMAGLDVATFALAAAFGTWLQLALLLITWFLWASQPISQTLVVRIVERLEKSPKGAITTVGLAVSAIASVLSAWLKT
jgi:hypothetical protein